MKFNIHFLLLTATIFIATSLHSHAQQNDSCITCHQDSFLAHKYPHIEVTLAQFKNTVHANFDCVDCHYQGYEDYPHCNKFISKVTCSECHQQQAIEYHNSGHYEARRSGNLSAPSCTDCHSIHDVKLPQTELQGSQSIEVCSQCHSDQTKNNRFQLKSNVVDSFKTSYHGQMYNLGFKGNRYATCVSCHDNHSILSKDSPDSTISKAHLVQTCAQCHPQANENFVGYLTHYSAEEDQNPILDKTVSFMETLILGTMAVFGLHTLLWFLITITQRSKIQKTHPKAVKQSIQSIYRFQLHERIQHIIMALSFLVLAFTGLPLKFSNSQLSQWLAQHTIGFEYAALIHRSAGITMILLFIVHLLIISWQIIIKRRSDYLWGMNSLIPQPQDIKDFFQHFSYFLHIRKKPPQFGRWTYWEKFDYLAVFWGMAVIGISGIMLMIPAYMTKLFPGWVINMCHIIHSEEALLATAFIFIVHFFNTHLRPAVFPMDDSIFSGRIPLEQLKKERPLEYEALKKSGKLKELEAQPLSYWKMILIRLIGFLFLFSGLTLLFLIITSLIFH